jgi:putative transposase
LTIFLLKSNYYIRLNGIIKERQNMIDFKAEISVSKQCKVFNLNRNFLFYSLESKSQQNLQIIFMLDKLYFTIPFYGYRKVKFGLQNQGLDINEKRVRRLMKLVNWKIIYRESKITVCNAEHKKYPLYPY